MTDTDLLGDPLTASTLKDKGWSARGKQWGYVMPPGTGPQGKTCGDCRHIHRTQRYRKCKLNRARWTGGPKTDILARSPSCSRFEEAG